MRRFHCAALAAVAVLGFTSVASAADMPVKAPPAPVVAPLYNWTGPYIGIAGGYGWGHSDQTDPGRPAPIGNGSYSLTGGILGGTLGSNWQQDRIARHAARTRWLRHGRYRQLAALCHWRARGRRSSSLGFIIVAVRQ